MSNVEVNCIKGKREKKTQSLKKYSKNSREETVISKSAIYPPQKIKKEWLVHWMHMEAEGEG